MAIRFARAFGCEVTAFSSTAGKEEEARAHGAHHFVSSVDDAELKAQRESLDLIISTVNRPLNWNRYVNALRVDGVLSFVGALPEPLTIATGMLMARRRSVSGSLIGGRIAMREMLDFAARHGIGAKVVHRKKITRILPVTLPCILLLKGANACVLSAFEGSGSAKVIVPESGGETKVVPISSLQDQFTGYAIFARPEFRFDERAPDIRVKQYKSWFWGTLLQFWPVYGHVLLASVLINSFAVASPLFIMNVYDRVVPNAAIETLWVLATGVMIVFMFDFLLKGLRGYFIDAAGKR